MLKAIHTQESLEAAREKAAKIVEQLRAMKLGKATTRTAYRRDTQLLSLSTVSLDTDQDQ